MSVEIAASENRAVARPLHVLVPLIKKDLEQGKEASARAGLPYYRAAGEKLLEARGPKEKPRMTFKELTEWAKRNFDVSTTAVKIYMSFANPEVAAATFESLRDFERRALGRKRRDAPRRAGPINDIIKDVDVETLRQVELERAQDREAQRKLARQLIDIGYKTLATKLHPDKGGSREAMTRLNQVRDRLRQYV